MAMRRRWLNSSKAIGVGRPTRPDLLRHQASLVPGDEFLDGGLVPRTTSSPFGVEDLAPYAMASGANGARCGSIAAATASWSRRRPFAGGHPVVPRRPLPGIVTFACSNNVLLMKAPVTSTVTHEAVDARSVALGAASQRPAKLSSQ